MDRLKGKPPNPRDGPRPEASSGRAAQGLRVYCLHGFLGVALVLLATTLLALAVLERWERNRDSRYLAGTARLLVQGAAEGLDPVRRLLASVATDPAVQEALAGGRPERLRDLETRLKGRLPGALAVQLFTAAQISTAEGIPSIGHAGLDLTRRAAKEHRVTPLEAHKVGQPGMHLAVAGPVLEPGGDQVLGVVHLALPLSLLPSAGRLANALGVAAYRQVVGAQAVPLDTKAEQPETAPDQTLEIPESRLQVALWGPPRDLLDPRLLGGLGAIYLIVLGAIGIPLWLTHRRLRRDLQADAQEFVSLVLDALQRRPNRQPNSRISEVQRAHQDLVTQLRGHWVTGPTPEATPTPRGTAAPAEIGRAKARGAREVSPGDPLQDWNVCGDSADSEGLAALDELDPPDPLAARGSLPSPRAAMPPPSGRHPGPDTALAPLQVPPIIFRAYDIRGRLGRELTAEHAQAIGWALGSAALAGGDRTLVLGRDCRPSSPELTAAVAAGARSAGLEVVDLGVVPTPVVYFACCHPEPRAGAVITGSHNPIDYNGIKPVLRGQSADSEAIQGLRRRIESGELVTGSGSYRRLDLIPQYLGHIAHDIALARPLKVVVDCGHATASTVAPALYRALGCNLIEHRCDPCAGTDETVPDPARPALLGPLGDRVVAEAADLGLAFDGDGDRLGVVDSRGRFIPADRVLMLLATDVLTRNPGTDVVFDVKCSGHLAEEILRAGGRPVMWRSGHAPLKAKLRETGALIAGELSGHIIFQERWFGFDDAIYAGARLLEILSLDPRGSEEIFAALPSGVVTPELSLPLGDDEPGRVMQALIEGASELGAAELIFIDGLRAEFEDGWGLVRASNTEPKLTFRFEGRDQAALEDIQSRFRRLLERSTPRLHPPF